MAGKAKPGTEWPRLDDSHPKSPGLKDYENQQVIVQMSPVMPVNLRRNYDLGQEPGKEKKGGGFR